MTYKTFTSEALAARKLVELRDRWLNPPEWVKWVDEPVPGYPKRPVPRNEGRREGSQETDADETSTTPGRSGSRMHTRRWTLPSRRPTAGLPISPMTMPCANCSNTTAATDPRVTRSPARSDLLVGSAQVWVGVP